MTRALLTAVLASAVLAGSAAGAVTPVKVMTGRNPSLAKNPAGGLGLVASNGKIVYATNRSGTWRKTQITSTAAPKGDWQPKLVYGSNGKGYVVFGRSNGTSVVGLFLATNASGTWKTRQLTNAKAFGHSIAISGTTLYVAYQTASTTTTISLLKVAGGTTTKTTVATGSVGEADVTMQGTTPVVAFARYTGSNCGMYWREGGTAPQQLTTPSTDPFTDFPACNYLPAYTDVTTSKHDGPHVFFGYLGDTSSNPSGYPHGLYEAFFYNGPDSPGLRDQAVTTYPQPPGVVPQNPSAAEAGTSMWVAFESIAGGSSTNGIFLAHRVYTPNTVGPAGYQWELRSTTRLTTRTSACSAAGTCDREPSLAVPASGTPYVAFQRGSTVSGKHVDTVYVTHG